MAKSTKSLIGLVNKGKKLAGGVIPSNAQNGEKTIPINARQKGLPAGPSHLTKANRGK